MPNKEKGVYHLEYIEINKSHHGQTIQVPKGSILKVSLAENPTTGYRWELDKPIDKHLQVYSDDFTISDEKAIGSGGLRILCFQPIKPDRYLLSLKHWCPWEGEESVEDRFQVTIEAK